MTLRDSVASNQDAAIPLSASRMRITTAKSVGNYFWDRSFLTFDLSGAPMAGVVDSARLFLGSNISNGAGYDSTIVVQGTQTGQLNYDWFNDIKNWAASGVYNLTNTIYSDTVDASGAGAVSFLLATDTVKAAIKAAMGSGDFKAAILTLADINDRLIEDLDLFYSERNTANTYIHIYYLVNPPSVSHVADSDTIKTVDVSVVVFIDSTGGSDLDSLGVQYFVFDGEADTSRVDSTGTFDETDSVSITIPNLLPDTSYQYRPVGVNPAGESFGDWDTLTTTITGGGAALSVDGRTVNTAK